MEILAWPRSMTESLRANASSSSTVHRAAAGASSNTTHASVSSMSDSKASSAATFALSEAVTLNIVLFVLLAVYVLSRLPGSWRRLTQCSWRKGWLLLRRPAAQPATTSTAPPSASRLTAYLRVYYNMLLLPIVPLVDLSVAQCLVLLSYGLVVTLIALSAAPDASSSVDAFQTGRIAVAQLPVLFLLATKNSIIGLLTGQSYAKLNYIHRFAGRSVVLFSALHTLVWINHLHAAGKLDLLGSPVQVTGLVGILALALVLGTSLGAFRSAAYQAFVISHVLGWMIFVVAAALHVPYARPWVLISLAAILADHAVRLLRTRVRNANLQSLSLYDAPQRGGMTEIRVDSIRSGWKAGQHVRLWTLDARSGYRAHPFTIAAAPVVQDGQKHTGLTLYAKHVGGFTRALESRSCSSLDSPGSEKGLGQSKVRLCIEGPYGHGLAGSLSECSTVMLVAGGSGITYLLSALSELTNASRPSPRNQDVQVVYVVQKLDDSTRYFLSILDEAVCSAQGLGVRLTVEVYVTRTGLSSDMDLETKAFPGVYFRQGRPELLYCVSEFLRGARGQLAPGARGTGAVLATCGPRSLVDAARHAASRVDIPLALAVGGLVVHSECFAW